MRELTYYARGFYAGQDAGYGGFSEASVETAVNNIRIEMGGRFTKRCEADYRDGYRAGYQMADDGCEVHGTL